MMNPDKPTRTSSQVPNALSSAFAKLTVGPNKLIAAVVAIVLIIAAVWLLALKTGPTDYKYNNLASYQLPGYQPGYGMTFSYPVQLQANTAKTKNLQTQELVHNKTLKNKRFITLTIEAAGISYLPQHKDFDESYFQYIGKALIDSSNKSYNTFRNPLKSYVANSINPRFKVTLGKTQSFTNPNIKSHAWLTEFTAVDNKPVQTYSPKTMSGDILMAVSQKGYYYLTIGSVDDNWKNNSGVWQRILDSVKVDQ